jgi:hypothetical protein
MIGTIAMSAVGWTWLRRAFRRVTTQKSGPRRFSKPRRKTIPCVEPLEAVALLSGGVRLFSDGWPHVHHQSNQRIVRHLEPPHLLSTSDTSSNPAPVTTPTQTVSIGNTLTNFSNLPLSPALKLFDPSLGTLLSVAVSHTASIQSNIKSQNLSPTSSTVIIAALAGSFQIDGLNQPISQPTKIVASQPMPAGPFGSGTDTVVFPPLVIQDSAATIYTDPTTLAFFTGSSGRTAITLTMSAKATATAAAPNGNLFTTTQTTASGMVTVSYTYIPVCPTVSSIGRIGIHHQRTELIVTFEGPVDPAKAADADNYLVITAAGNRVPITTATYNPATNSVTLIPAQRLNVHHHFKLSLVIPCRNEQTGETVIIPFGGKSSLIGFHNHLGEFVSVQNGRITGFSDKRDQFVPVHNGKIESLTHRSARHEKEDQVQRPMAFHRKPGFYRRAESVPKLSVLRTPVRI